MKFLGMVAPNDNDSLSQSSEGAEYISVGWQLTRIIGNFTTWSVELWRLDQLPLQGSAICCRRLAPCLVCRHRGRQAGCRRRALRHSYPQVCQVSVRIRGEQSLCRANRVTRSFLAWQ